MIYLGFVLIAVSVGFFVSSWCAAMRRSGNEYSAVLELLVYIRGALVAERRTPSEAIASFARSDNGRYVPWLFELQDGERVNSFLRERRLFAVESLLSQDDKKALCDFFADFGKSCADEEGLRLDRIIALFEKRVNEKRASTENNVKSIWVLFITAALGLLILLI